MVGNLDLENSDLDLKLSVVEGEDEDDVHEKGEHRGFCVFGKKICVFGNNGLFIADVLDP